MEQPVLEYAELEGERVRLRPVDPADAPAAFALVHEERAILDWLIWPGPRDEAELAAYYARWRRPGKGGCDYLFAIEARATGAFTGCIGAHFADHPGSGTLGYWLGVEHWNKGYVSEAVGLIDHLAFRYLEAHVLSACVFEGNDASRRVLERNGYAEEYVAKCDLRGEVRVQRHQALSRDTYLALSDPVAPVREDVRLAADA